MLPWSNLVSFLFDNPFAKAGAAVMAIVSLVGLYSCEQRQLGATRERAKIERQANDNVKKATSVRTASERGDAGGVLDPYAAGR